MFKIVWNVVRLAWDQLIAHIKVKSAYERYFGYYNPLTRMENHFLFLFWN